MISRKTPYVICFIMYTHFLEEFDLILQIFIRLISDLNIAGFVEYNNVLKLHFFSKPNLQNKRNQIRRKENNATVTDVRCMGKTNFAKQKYSYMLSSGGGNNIRIVKVEKCKVHKNSIGQ